MKVRDHPGQLSHLFLQRRDAVVPSAGAVIDRIEQHLASIILHVGVPGQAHDAETLVGHVVRRQHHGIGIAAAEGVLPHHQEGIELFLPVGGKAGDLHFDLVAVVVHHGGALRLAAGAGVVHVGRSGNQVPGDKARHDDGGDHGQGDVQPPQDLLPAGTRSAGTFFPRLFLCLLQAGTALVVLFLFRVHSIDPFRFSRAQANPAPAPCLHARAGPGPPFPGCSSHTRPAPLRPDPGKPGS